MHHQLQPKVMASRRHYFKESNAVLTRFASLFFNWMFWKTTTKYKNDRSFKKHSTVAKTQRSAETVPFERETGRPNTSRRSERETRAASSLARPVAPSCSSTATRQAGTCSDRWRRRKRATSDGGVTEARKPGSELSRRHQIHRAKSYFEDLH